jgi:hypothetical protein
VQVYLTKVSDASTADGSTGWFKIFSDSWAKKSGGSTGDDDYWGTRDLNACCGKMDVKIPADIPSGDYLLRAEALALHTASSVGGAQFYMSCYQITVSGGGNASPATVKFPGAYSASDPGIKINIHAAVSGYIAPGPAVYSGGTTRQAGSACSGCESTCKVGSSPTAVAGSGKSTTGTDGGSNSGTTGGSTDSGSTTSPDSGSSGNSGSSGGGANACSVQAYGQCGGTGYTGCSSCAVSLGSVSFFDGDPMADKSKLLQDGYTCKAVSPPYYSQCAPSS